MNDIGYSLEEIWDGLLSRETEKIRMIYQTLDENSRKTAFQHLQKMSTEEGWHPDQRLSAQTALAALKDIMG